jgi:hypothetical protein
MLFQDEPAYQKKRALLTERGSGQFRDLRKASSVFDLLQRLDAVGVEMMNIDVACETEGRDLVREEALEYVAFLEFMETHTMVIRQEMVRRLDEPKRRGSKYTQ